jgi:hypothetical protein
MKLTKDEASILAYAMEVAKYEMLTTSFNVYTSLEHLQNRLEEAGKDKRRRGRTTQNDWNDLLKRFIKKTKNITDAKHNR